MKKTLTALITFLFPSFLLGFILRGLGHHIGSQVKIGFSFLFVDHIALNNNTKIGHLNLFINDKIRLDKGAIIGYLNILKGPFILQLGKRAALGNKNYITRANLGITYGESTLSLGELTKVTTGHHLDMTRSITFGDFSILAGVRSQMWTHGYYHADKGPDRIRIDGEIHIGDNVYIGSSCIFNPGVSVVDAVHVGGGSVISKNLDQSGMYVGQALRHFPNNIDSVKEKLIKVNNEGVTLVEQVFSKHPIDGKDA